MKKDVAIYIMGALLLLTTYLCFSYITLIPQHKNL